MKIERLKYKECKELIIFGNMNADMINNKNPNPIVIEIFIRGRKLNILFVLITQSYFAVPKRVRLIFTRFIMKVQNKQVLQ